MPAGKLEKERTPWAWEGPFERAAFGNLISHIRSRVHVGLGDDTGFRAVKGGHGRESHTVSICSMSLGKVTVPELITVS